MCTNISVNLPTIGSFLMLYSLRTGCVVILLWTIFRSLFMLFFFFVAIVETFLPVRSPLGALIHEMSPGTYHGEYYFTVFVGHLVMIVTECFILIYTIYLGMGIYYCTACRINQFLICRFCTWVVEIIFLVMLCLLHQSLIGWYLVFLMIVILECYAFLVVYSYYVELVVEETMKYCDDPMQENYMNEIMEQDPSGREVPDNIRTVPCPALTKQAHLPDSHRPC